jgi:acetyl esterase
LPLDPQVERLVEMINSRGIYRSGPFATEAEGRKNFHDFFMTLLEDSNKLWGSVKRKDVLIMGTESKIPLRIYTPPGIQPLPILVYFHGGGWSRGDLDIWDGFCSELSAKSSHIVVSVDYRLSPEYRFPCALNDAYDATVWVSRNGQKYGGDPGRLAVGGDSAGGNLAAAVCLLARDRENFPKIAFQLLVYPALNYVFDTRSYLDNSNTFFLTRERSISNWNNYLSDPSDAGNPYACPSIAPSLAGLPRAMIVTAEYDPLRDEGEEYATRLNRDGVRAKYACYLGMIHPFVLLAPYLDAGKKAIDSMAKEVKDVLGKSNS